MSLKSEAQRLFYLVNRTDYDKNDMDEMNERLGVNIINYDDNDIWINWDLLDNVPMGYHIIVQFFLNNK